MKGLFLKMTSQDMQILSLMLDNHFQKTNALIMEQKADNAEFKAQMLESMNNFTNNINAKFDAFTEKNEKKFDAFTERNEKKFDAFTSEINAKINDLKIQVNENTRAVYSIQSDLNGIHHDVQNLYTWNYWLLSVIIAVFVLPQFMEQLQKLFHAVIKGIKFIRSVFRKN